MDGSLRALISFLADVLGIVGFLIGLWTLQTAKRIRREIRRRRRLPEIHRDLSEKLRRFVVARRSDDRVEVRRLAKGFLRALDELKELGRAIKLERQDREALHQLAARANYDQLESIEPIMHDVVEAVAQAKEDE